MTPLDPPFKDPFNPASYPKGGGQAIRKHIQETVLPSTWKPEEHGKSFAEIDAQEPTTTLVIPNLAAHNVVLRVTVPVQGGGSSEDDMKMASWVQHVVRYRLHNQEVSVEIIQRGPDDEYGELVVGECTREAGHATPCNGWPRDHVCPIAPALPWTNKGVEAREAARG